jgi:hypothetical protein
MCHGKTEKPLAQQAEHKLEYIQMARYANYVSCPATWQPVFSHVVGQVGHACSECHLLVMTRTQAPHQAQQHSGEQPKGNAQQESNCATSTNGGGGG